MHGAIRRRKSLLYLGFAALACVVGCSTSISSRSTTGAGSLTGLVYHLPATELNIAITYRLTGCGDGNPIVVSGLVVTSETVADTRPDATYVLDTTKLANAMKQVDTARIEFHENRITTVTYDAADKTGDVIKSAAKTAAALGGGFPSGLLVGGGGRRDAGGLFRREGAAASAAVLVCNTPTRHAVKERQQFVKAIDDMIDSRGALLRSLASGSDDAATKLDVLDARINGLQARVAAIDEGPLSITYTTSWIPTADDDDEIITPDAGALLGWFRVGDSVTANTLAPLLANAAITFVVTHENPYKKLSPPRAGGLFYRASAPVTLTASAPDYADFFSETIAMKQFGPVASIALTNGAFQDNKFEIIFDNEGNIASFDYLESVSQLNELAKVGGAAVEESQSAEAETLEREAEILRKRKALLDAERAVLVSEQELRDALANIEDKESD